MTQSRGLEGTLQGFQERFSSEFHRIQRATYVALDFPTWVQAEAIVNQFGPLVDGYKVGLELFHGDGPRTLQELAKLGKRVFLDVKLHDIPNTVAGALKAIRRFPGIEMVNVHAAGGQRMMVAARKALDAGGEFASKPLLIAVTLLTSLDETDLEALGWPDTAQAMVVRLAALASSCGLDGVVASAREIEPIVARIARPFEIVVPGTRPIGSDAFDQKRTLTPGEAFSQGATRLVLGRAVTAAQSPEVALTQIWQDMLSTHQD